MIIHNIYLIEKYKICHKKTQIRQTIFTSYFIDIVIPILTHYVGLVIRENITTFTVELIRYTQSKYKHIYATVIKM